MRASCSSGPRAETDDREGRGRKGTKGGARARTPVLLNMGLEEDKVIAALEVQKEDEKPLLRLQGLEDVASGSASGSGSGAVASPQER